MFCQKCGTQNPDNGKFCRACGVNLSPLSNAAAGKLSDKMPDSWMIKPIQPAQLWGKKGKSVSWESAMVKLFTGFAFLAVSLILGFTQTRNDWWFWLLIPAFSILGGAVAQIIQLKKASANSLNSPAETRQNIASGTNNALPPTQTDYVQPQKSIYKTGELVAPPSVVEGTTRHLEMNTEGETMTLPESERWKTGNGR